MEEQYRHLFDQKLQEATRLGIEWRPIRAADSVHTVANVNNENEKDRIRQERGLPSADPDATAVNKGERDVTEAGGEVVRKKIRYNSYKTHVSMATESRMVTAMTTTPGLGNEADCNQMVALMNLDKATSLAVETHTADRGYDDGGLHEELKERGKHDALKLRRFRTTKKDANKERWLKLQADPHYQEGLSQRYTIETSSARPRRGMALGEATPLGRPDTLRRHS